MKLATMKQHIKDLNSCNVYTTFHGTFAIEPKSSYE